MYYLYWLKCLRKYAPLNAHEHSVYLSDEAFTYTGIEAESKQEMLNFREWAMHKQPGEQIDNLEFLWNLYQTNGST